VCVVTDVQRFYAPAGAYILVSVGLSVYIIAMECRSSAVGLAIGYGLKYRRVGVRVPPYRVNNFSLLHIV
jgi:hypothetical protein